MNELDKYEPRYQAGGYTPEQARTVVRENKAMIDEFAINEKQLKAVVEAATDKLLVRILVGGGVIGASVVIAYTVL